MKERRADDERLNGVVASVMATTPHTQTAEKGTKRHRIKNKIMSYSFRFI